jgi:hypothetical protein
MTGIEPRSTREKAPELNSRWTTNYNCVSHLDPVKLTSTRNDDLFTGSNVAAISPCHSGLAFTGYPDSYAL